MNRNELLRTNLNTWDNVLGYEFPGLHKLVRKTLLNPQTTESCLVRLYQEIHVAGGWPEYMYEDRQTTGTPTVNGSVQSLPPKTIAEPRKLVSGWHDIATVLCLPYAKRREIKSLNTRFEGPITNCGPGTRPMVDLETLLDWWNKLAILSQDLENQRQGAKLSARAEYRYGRDGVVAPEINGSVKKRRRGKQT